MKKMRKYVNLLAVLLVAFGFLFSFTACSDNSSSSTDTEDTDTEGTDTEDTDTEDTDTEDTDTEDTDYTEEYEIILAIERAINAGLTDYWTLSDDETTYTCGTTYTKDVTGSYEDSTVSYSVTINSGSYLYGAKTTSDDETVTTTKYYYDISAVVDETDYTYVYSSTKIKTYDGDTYEVEYSYTITLNGKTIPGYEEYIEALETASSEEE